MIALVAGAACGQLFYLILGFPQTIVGFLIEMSISGFVGMAVDLYFRREY